MGEKQLQPVFQTNCWPIITTADRFGHHRSSLPESSWLAGSVARTCVCVCPSLPRTHTGLQLLHNIHFTIHRLQNLDCAGNKCSKCSSTKVPSWSSSVWGPSYSSITVGLHCPPHLGMASFCYTPTDPARPQIFGCPTL